MGIKRKHLLTTLLALSLTAGGLQAEGSSKEPLVKRGYNFAPLPAVSYNSDLGFQYGVSCDMFDYGSGDTYPQYKHKLTAELSTFTKGSSICDLFYDSKYLVEGIRTKASVTYLPDKLLDFYGFNGYEAPYIEELNPSFYKIDRKYFRSYIELQGALVGKLSWAAGLSYRRYRVSEVDIEQYEGEDNLLSHYIDAGIIDEDGCHGNTMELKLGVLHDTRDREADPTKGFFSEVTLSSSADLFNGRNENYARLSMIHRGYLPLWDRYITLSYRVGYQGIVAGDAPFYLLPDMLTLDQKQTISEGLGGLCSIRGVLRNRVVSRSYAWSNVELRLRPLHFQLIGQEWYIAINPLFDMGRVLTPYRAEELADSGDPYLYSGEEEQLHLSAGIGGKLVMNQNFVLSIEYGKTLDSRDGRNSLYLGTNYIF